MSLALLKGCIGLALGGSAIAVPAYFLTKLSGSNSTSVVESKPVATSSRPAPRATDPQTQRFNDCLDGNLKVQVTKGDQTHIVSIGELKRYPEKDGWTHESLYKNQCQDLNH